MAEEEEEEESRTLPAVSDSDSPGVLRMSQRGSFFSRMFCRSCVDTLLARTLGLEEEEEAGVETTTGSEEQGERSTSWPRYSLFVVRWTWTCTWMRSEETEGEEEEGETWEGEGESR